MIIMYLCAICGLVLLSKELCPYCGIQPVKPSDFNFYGIEAWFEETYTQKKGLPLGQSDHYIIRKNIMDTNIGGIFNERNGLLGLIIRKVKAKSIQLKICDVYANMIIEMIKSTHSSIPEIYLKDQNGTIVGSVEKSVFEAFQQKLFIKNRNQRKEIYAVGDFKRFNYNIFPLTNNIKPLAIIRPIEAFKKKGIAPGCTIEDCFMIKFMVELPFIKQLQALCLMMLTQEEYGMKTKIHGSLQTFH